MSLDVGDGLRVNLGVLPGGNYYFLFRFGIGGSNANRLTILVNSAAFYYSVNIIFVIDCFT